MVNDVIRVLRKTFDVLEFVAMRKQPVLPRELERPLGLSQPTAVRILRELAELGYLEQAGPRKGYVPGPAAFQVTGGGSYRPEFMHFAAPLIEECARELGQSVQFAVRRGEYRYILCHYNFNPAFDIDVARIRFHDLYATGSGRLTLSFAPESELRTLIRKIGLPAKSVWPEAGDEAALIRELGLIRTARQVEFERSTCGHFHVYARALFLDREFAGAVAANWETGASPDYSEQCRKRIDRLAEQLGGPKKIIAG